MAFWVLVFAWVMLGFYVCVWLYLFTLIRRDARSDKQRRAALHALCVDLKRRGQADK
jgi:hypothetical protein